MTIRLRHIAKINPAVPGWDQIPEDEQLTFVPLEAVWSRNIDFSRTRPKSQTATGYTRFMENDIIVPKITPTFEANRSSLVNGSPTQVLTGTTELHVVRPGPMVEPRYLSYVLSSSTFLQEGESQMVGVAGQKRIPDEWLRNYRIPITSQETQQGIADTLDIETARIDALIEKKRRLLELLRERRKLLGEEKLDNMRRRERSAKLKHLVTESNERHGSGCQPSILSVSIHHGVVPRSEITDNESRADDFSSYRTCRPGDIVVNSMRAFQGAVGVVRHDGIVSPAYMVLHVSDSISSSYLHFVMRSPWFISEMTRRLRGIGSTNQGQARTPHINFAQLGQIRVPVPSRGCQEQFVSNLVGKENDLTRAVDLQGQQITLLTERRQALVTAAISGQV